MKLRDYQRRAVDSPIKYWQENKGSHPIIVAGTGSGKSVIQAFFIKEALTAFPATRILCLTHVKELIEQNEERFRGVWHDAPSGVWSSGLKRKEDTQVMFAGIQSIHKKAFDFTRFDIIIIDECHLMPKTGTGMYRSFIDNCMLANPQLKVIGMTASPFRLDGGSLIDGDGALFDGISCHVTVKELIEAGFLTPLTAKEGIHHIETKNLATQNGEYKTSDIEDAFDANSTTELAIEEILELGKDRKSVMIFCSSVKHCIEVTERLEILGQTAVAVHGGITDKERDDAIESFKNWGCRFIVSVNILTTGFDVAQVDMIALMRSTKSASLYLQICGRGMRLLTGKKDCLVLDFGENILNHGAIDEIVERQLEMGGKKKGKKGEAVMKRCPECETMCYASTRICPECNTPFDISTLPKIQQNAARLAILSSEREDDELELDVSNVSYVRHNKAGKPSSMKVTYGVGNVSDYSEWICLEHEGFARAKAIQWWRKRMGDEIDCPTSVDDAIDSIRRTGIKEPLKIKVITGRKYPEITEYLFATS